MSAQLDIFEGTEFAVLNEKLENAQKLSEKTRETSENVRRGVFARLTNLERIFLQKFLDQQKKIDEIEEIIFNLYKEK